MIAAKKSKNVAVVIPVHNEEDSLPLVLQDLPRDLVREIIVVDNASTDQSAAVAKQHGCRVIREEQRGYGKACLSGIARIPDGTDIVVFLDGDYSDHAEQLPRLLQPLLEEGCDFVIGSRALGSREEGALAPQAYYGNKLACFLMGALWGATYTDLGPFRAITFPALKQLNMQDTDYGWTVEMQIKALQAGLTVKEVPVDYRRRIGQSKISGTLKGTILAGQKILWTIFKYRFLMASLKT